MSISKGRTKIAVVYFELDRYYSSYNAVDELGKEIGKAWDTFNKIGTIEEAKINGVSWYKISFEGIYEGDKGKGQLLAYSTGYEVYALSYVSPEKEYGLNLDVAEEIINSLVIEVDEAANIKAGEWDGGNAGYYVFNEDNTLFIYEKSTKDKNNVFHATYTAKDKIATYSAGYVDGVTVVTTITKVIKNGKEEDGSIGNQHEYAFQEKADGDLEATSITMGTKYILKRVK